MTTHTNDSKILLVEDDHKIAQLLIRFLETEKFVVEHCDHGNDASNHIRSFNPDIIILDMLLPGKDGLQVFQEARTFFNKGIIMLTAQDDDLNETIALNMGIDDYLTKPVRPHVLLAHIHAVLRRVTPKQENVITVQDLVINKINRTVKRNDSPVLMSDSEFELLWILAQQSGEVVKRDDLFLTLRGKPYDGTDRSIDMRVSTLRKALQKGNPENEYIKTLRQQGYILIHQ